MSDLQLINLFSTNESVLSDKGFLPLGLILIANYLKKYGYTTEILDTQSKSLDTITEMLNSKIIGFNYTIMSTDLLDEAASLAKKKDAIVVVGGQAATASAKQLLINNKNIDFVVCNDGELSMFKLMQLLIDGDGSLESIPNLVYRKNGVVIQNQIQTVKMKDLSIPDRTIPGIDMEWYVNNFKAFGYPLLDEPWYNATNVFTKKGCPRRSNNKGCSFCARVDKRYNAKTSMQTYLEYKFIRDEYGINYIFDDSDSWIRMDAMNGLYQCYKAYGDLGVEIRVYGDIRDITPESVNLMKELNVVSILVGIESGSEEILIKNNKAMSHNQIIQAIQLLAKNRISICPAYVLGLLGESETSLAQTFEMSREIDMFGNVQTCYWNFITPLPGSMIWDKMMSIPTLRNKYKNNYSFNIKELRTDYIDCFCKLGNNGLNIIQDFYKHVSEITDIPIGEYLR